MTFASRPKSTLILLPTVFLLGLTPIAPDSAQHAIANASPENEANGNTEPRMLESCCAGPNLRAMMLTGNEPTPSVRFAAEVAAETDAPASSNPEISDPETSSSPEPPAGMIAIPGGKFEMGSDGPMSLPQERPAHEIEVAPFWIDAHEVTNAQFAAFVEATNYVTTAERAPTMEEVMSQLPPGTPEPPAEVLVAGSLVFRQTAGPVSLGNPAAWWAWTPGASWRHPEGPASNIDNRMSHPVVQVSWDDAMAYCEWAGRQLPTEAQWEFAARGGMEEATFTWGNERLQDQQPMANTWDGVFPHLNHADAPADTAIAYANRPNDGFVTAAPVGSFPANGYGLYDMSGNVWEWCADRYDAALYRRRAAAYVRDSESGLPVAAVCDPAGPERSYDPNNPYTQPRAIRGGSFLCNDSYCSSYRPSARMGSSPDTGLSHTGFRTVWVPLD